MENIDVAGKLVPLVEDIRDSGDGAAILMVRWRLEAGRVAAEVLQDQVRVALDATDEEVQDALEERAGQVAAQYFDTDAPSIQELRERILGQNLAKEPR